MKAILDVGVAHSLYNKVVEVEPTNYVGCNGTIEVKTVEKHDLHSVALIYRGDKLIREEPTVTTDYVTAWAKEIIREKDLLVNVYYRMNDTLGKGVGFQLFGNCLQNCCVKYYLSDEEIETLWSDHMVLHGDLIIIPSSENHKEDK